MKIININTCNKCPYYCSENEIHRAWCSKKRDSFEWRHNGNTIPDWCPLEDVPKQSALDLVKKQAYELSVIRSGLERLRHDNDWHGVEEVNEFFDKLLAVGKE